MRADWRFVVDAHGHVKLRIKSARGETAWNPDDHRIAVEAALQTGKLSGIGEFMPPDWDAGKACMLAKRLIEHRTLHGLAQKY